MSEELITKIIEMLGEIGDGGFALIAALIGYEYFSSILVALCILIPVYWVIRVVNFGLDERKFIQQVAERVGYEMYGEVGQKDRDRILGKLDRLIDQKES